MSCLQRGPMVTEADGRMLSVPVTATEIKEILWTIGYNKYLGPYGFTFAFYRKAWLVVGDLVVEAVQEAF